MKLLVGNPGKIDGHIPPDKIPGIRPESYDTVCYATRDKERSKPCDGHMIDGKEIHLFNITGNRIFLFTMSLNLITNLSFRLKSQFSFFLADPYEYHNIAQENSKLVDDMMKRLEEYQASMIPPNIGPDTDDGDPRKFNNTFAPGWCESEPNFRNLELDIDIDILN